MSYEKVKSIRLSNANKKVHINCAASNLTPLVYEKWISFQLSKIFEESGRDEVIKEILYLFWSGEYKSSNNNVYQKVVNMYTDYTKYTWDNVKTNNPNSIKKLKNHLFKNYLRYKSQKKGKFVALKHNVFIKKITKRTISTVPSVEHAKIFSTEDDLQYYCKDFTDIKVIELKPYDEAAIRKFNNVNETLKRNIKREV